MTESAPVSDRPRPRDELELEIDSLAYGGRGGARRNGYVVFVSGALPGDRVRATVTKSKRTYAEARTVELLRPSTERVPDRCDHGGEPCPGAPWQGLAHERPPPPNQDPVEDPPPPVGGADGGEA